MELNPYQPPESERLVPVAAPREGFSQWSLASLLAIGFGLGIASRLTRPYGNLFGIHWDAVAAVITLALLSTALLVRCFHTPLWQAMSCFQVGVLLLWCAFVAGWSIVAGHLFGPLVQTCAAWWFVIAVIGTIILMIRNRVAALAITGDRQNRG